MRSGTGEEAPNCGNGLEAEARVDAKAVRRRGQYGVATALAADELERSDRHRGADAPPPVTALGRDVLNLCGSRSVEYACRRDDIAVDQTEQVLEPGARSAVGRAAKLCNTADERLVRFPDKIRTHAWRSSRSRARRMSMSIGDGPLVSTARSATIAGSCS